jgi:uncharacterized membrane-anchored protein
MRYWAAMSIASVFGASLGDFISHNLHLGHWRGVPPLAVLLALTLLAASRNRARVVVFYWVAVVIIRAAATNIGDLATHDLRLGDHALIAVLAVLLVVSALVPASIGRSTAIVADAHVTRGAEVPETSTSYWITLFIAGTLGTVLGDDASDRYGLAAASLVLSVVLGMLLWLRQRMNAAGKGSYWLTVLAARTAGTSVGDLLASRRGFGLGLSTTTAGASLLLVGLLLFWRQSDRARQAQMSA